jgi:putative nucleotidyltransferase with HDIG domain
MRARDARPRIGVDADGSRRDAILAALDGHSDPVSGLAERADLWVIAPAGSDAAGVRALRQLRLEDPDRPCIVIAPPDVSASLVRDWYRNGAADVVGATELPGGLRRAIERALERAARSDALWREVEGSGRAQGLEAALRSVRDGYDQTLSALVTALDCRERETACHSQRVAAFSVYLGLELGIEGDDLEDLYRGALLHDIGKIGIPDAVLLKPGTLTEEEWAVMRGHAELGAEITRRIEFLKGASVVPLAHHEAWDGSGYPRGLRGEEIPLHARIFALADTYDALRSTRPYRAGCSHAHAMAQVRAAGGGQLDPRLAEPFVHVPEDVLGRIAAAVEGTCTYAETLAACCEAREP